VLLPYARGDLLARIHADGRITTTIHEEVGTRVRAREPHALAAALSEYAHAGSSGDPETNGVPERNGRAQV
jgi:GTP-binding protein HflX